jgi:hypothetical protein
MGGVDVTGDVIAHHGHLGCRHPHVVHHRIEDRAFGLAEHQRLPARRTFERGKKRPDIEQQAARGAPVGAAAQPDQARPRLIVDRVIVERAVQVEDDGSVASFVSAHRAARLDPLNALREE